MQIVQEQQDRAYTYQAAYRVAEDRFVRLADDTIRNVTVLPHDRYAYGTDNREYQQAASYSGRNFADLYTYDLRTGAHEGAVEASVALRHPRA